MFQKTPCISGLSLSKVLFAAQIEPEKWPSACQITLLIRVFASQIETPKFHYIPQCFRDSKMSLYTIKSITAYQQPCEDDFLGQVLKFRICRRFKKSKQALKTFLPSSISLYTQRKPLSSRYIKLSTICFWQKLCLLQIDLFLLQNLQYLVLTQKICVNRLYNFWPIFATFFGKKLCLLDLPMRTPLC